jgi:hypothetical protein
VAPPDRALLHRVVRPALAGRRLPHPRRAVHHQVALLHPAHRVRRARLVHPVALRHLPAAVEALSTSCLPLD